ncbi:MAG: phosphomethylpyrimidine synthase ThiC, partial [Armatimonadetes bacterium]|nr:phosphomethylpyrimidine synthase ThiC [Armatimonadota bacterium]
MTQLDLARAGKISPEMVSVARDENLDPEVVCAGVEAGTIVIPRNVNHDIGKICG